MRNFHVFPRIVLATVPALLLMVSAACHKQVPEQAVRAQLAALQAAMDARDATAVRDLLATDFIGEQGLEKRGAHQLAAGLFLRYREVSAKIGPIQVEVLDPSNAIARFHSCNPCFRGQPCRFITTNTKRIVSVPCRCWGCIGGFDWT